MKKKSTTQYPSKAIQTSSTKVHFQFKRVESVKGGIKRIITEQIEYAWCQLTNPTEGVEKGVHNARKCCKKIRATLRLAQGGITKSYFKRENMWFRDISRLLSPIRDSEVLGIAFDELCQRYTKQLANFDLSTVQSKLKAYHQATCDQEFKQKNSVDKAIGMLVSAHKRIDTMPISKNNFSVFEQGFKKVYKLGHRQMNEACKTFDPEKLHEWRKEIKYLYYYIQKLEPTWSKQQFTFAAELNKIADWLGEDHDLFELGLTLEKHPEWFKDKKTLKIVRQLIEHRRRKLYLKAYSLGQRIYAEDVDSFFNRNTVYWEIWRTNN